MEKASGVKRLKWNYVGFRPIRGLRKAARGLCDAVDQGNGRVELNGQIRDKFLSRGLLPIIAFESIRKELPLEVAMHVLRFAVRGSHEGGKKYLLCDGRSGFYKAGKIVVITSSASKKKYLAGETVGAEQDKLTGLKKKLFGKRIKNEEAVQVIGRLIASPRLRGFSTLNWNYFEYAILYSKCELGVRTIQINIDRKFDLLHVLREIFCGVTGLCGMKDLTKEDLLDFVNHNGRFNVAINCGTLFEETSDLMEFFSILGKKTEKTTLLIYGKSKNDLPFKGMAHI